jgi:nucleoside-diphosphate-sugar epimerase
VNLGNPVELTITEFAEHIKRLSGASSSIEHRELPEYDPKQRRPDIEKARRIPGWQPRVGLEDGLRATVEYFRQKDRVPVPRSGTPAFQLKP